MLLILTALLLATTISGQLISIEKDQLSLRIDEVDGSLAFTLHQDGQMKLSGQLGINTNLGVEPCLGIENCLNFGNARLHVYSNIRNGFTLLWSSLEEDISFMDCYDLSREDTNWFGGPERWHQYWPIEKLELHDFPNVVQEDGFGAIVEPYWLSSRGVYIFVDPKVPLFIDQNSFREGYVCFNGRSEKPYPTPRPRTLLNYTIAVGDNAREAHMHAVQHFLGKPTGHPNFKVIEKPIWSTWARYKKEISDTVLRQFASEIASFGYADGQFEIDDYWETCYGSLKFRDPEFTDITETVKIIKDMGFTSVALWTHPFVSTNCDYTDIGLANNFFIRNQDGSVLTSWWNSNTNGAQHVDFTNAEARDWFTSRLRLLQENHGIDTFKFDAGETSWLPQVPNLFGDVETSPNHHTTTYVRMCAEFGDLIEVRTGWGTQDLPVLVRMIDKDSRWGSDNGLYTLITTLMQMNMNGYTMVLPDYIGGNGYGERPTPELFVRWLQANTFMPTIQFSFVPWDFEGSEIDVVAISREFVELHAAYANEIIRIMDRSISEGYPVNPPVWWVDPLNPDALRLDTQYLLGEDIVVAPVIEEGKTSRDVYLPAGSWVDANTGVVYSGNTLLSDYSAPIEVLPYFVRSGSNAEQIHLARKNAKAM